MKKVCVITGGTGGIGFASGMEGLDRTMSWCAPGRPGRPEEIAFYGIVASVVSPTAKWTAKSVSNSNGVTTQMAMWKRIAIFYEEKYAEEF